MKITDATRSTAFRACWNMRAKTIYKQARLEKGSVMYSECNSEISDLTKAIDELR